MTLDPAALQELLLRENYISAEDLARAETFAQEHHVPLTDYLLSEGLLTKELLGQALAESAGLPYADLHAHPPSVQQVHKLAENLAREYRLVLYAEQADRLILTTDNPWREHLLADTQEIFAPKQVELMYALTEDIEAAFLHYQQALTVRFLDIIKQSRHAAPEIITAIFSDALTLRASDIHFEVQGDEVVIRFRIDGILHATGRIPKEQYENILNRIKVQAHLRIDDHFSAQDGAIRFEHDGDSVDMRVAIVPTVTGEKITIRLLAQYVRTVTLDELGLDAADQSQFAIAAAKPFGMILATGPTGSGKTTTLYALLKRLNRTEVNIMTIEDPVEYKVTGLNQIQVNPQTNLTFAKGLRSIVRQDPNIILVGEIRDQETAEIAVNAALTGHLLLSTFHANDAATTIPRLLEMGIEPFLLASTLELVVAQRLLRKICVNCRFSFAVTQAELKAILPTAADYFRTGSTTLYRGKGCTSCNYSGFQGRTAIFEFITMSPQLRDIVLRQASAQEITARARQQGMRTMFADGVEKVKNGLTTLEELLRVAKPDSPA